MPTVGEALQQAAALAAELKAAEDRGQPDDGTAYYQHWLAALERLVMEKGLTQRSALLERKEAWADAYRNTPHGFAQDTLAFQRELDSFGKDSLVQIHAIAG